MTSANYQALALVMRFVFCALGVAILVCALYTYLKDARNAKRLRRAERETGHMGVLEPEGHKAEKLFLSREGEAGSGRENDVVLKDVRSRRCFYYELVSGRLVITPIDGRISVPGRHDDRELVLSSGESFTADGRTYTYRLVKPHAEALSPANLRARGE